RRRPLPPCGPRRAAGERSPGVQSWACPWSCCISPSDRANSQPWRERLRLVAAFLNDAELRDEDSSKFRGLGAGFPYHKIEVRDFAAREIAGLLRIEVDLNLER